MTMSPETMKRLLEMGTNEEELLELLRQQESSQNAIDESYDSGSPTVRAGENTYVPNFADPIKGIFARGREGKKLEKAKAEAVDNRAGADQDVRAYIDSVNQGNKEASFIHNIPQANIAGNSKPSLSMPAEAMAPPMGGPPPPDPAGPPAPAMGPPPNAPPAPPPAVDPAAAAAQTPSPGASPPVDPMSMGGLKDLVPTAADMPGAGKAPTLMTGMQPNTNGPQDQGSLMEIILNKLRGRG